MNPFNPFYLLLLAVATAAFYYAYRNHLEQVKCGRIAENAVSDSMYVNANGALQLT